MEQFRPDLGRRTEHHTARLTLSVPGIDSIVFNRRRQPTTPSTSGEAVKATVTFDEAVTVTGTPQLTIDVGGADKVLELRLWERLDGARVHGLHGGLRG